MRTVCIEQRDNVIGYEDISLQLGSKPPDRTLSFVRPQASPLLVNTRMATFLLLSLLCFLLPLVLASPDNSVSPFFNSSWPSRKLISPIQAFAASASRIYTHTLQGKLTGREMLQIAALCSVFPAFWYLRIGRKSKTRSFTYNDSKSLNGSAHDTITKRGVDINGELCRRH